MERLICIAIGYACGLFQTAYILGKIYHIDIRKQGSGNLGSTNVLRTLGKKAGALNLLCDCLKCIAAILIVRAIFGNSYGDILPLLSLYAAAGCILGHNFPVFMGFKGGKGVSCSLGLLIVMNPLLGIGLVILAAAANLFIKLYSLVSIATMLLATILYAILDAGGDVIEIGVLIVMLLLMLFMHRQNIVRLLKGQEGKIDVFK